MMHIKVDKLSGVKMEYYTIIKQKIDNKFEDNEEAILHEAKACESNPIISKGTLIDSFIKDLLTLRLEDLCDMYVWVKDYLDGGKKSNKDKRKQKVYQQGEALAKLIFDYDMVDDNLKKKVKKAYGLEVCPYCNRQFITPIDVENGNIIPADLDHYFPQGKYHLFALSLYNFVPACLVCNRLIKLAQDDPIWYPYKEGFHKYVKFSVEGDGEELKITSLTGRDDEFKLNLKPTEDAPKEELAILKSTLKVFKLKETYQTHKQYVRELLYKKHAYNNTYQEELQNLFRNSGLPEADINILLYGSDLTDEHVDDRILGKLTCDIMR